MTAPPFLRTNKDLAKKLDFELQRIGLNEDQI
jgi:hypothetical protein